jgi:hypothetical protein
MPQHRNFVLTISLLQFSIGACQSTPTPPKPVGQGWFCYEGDTRAPGGYADHSTYCARDLEDCRSRRSCCGEVGEPPPASLTECARRDKAVCGAAQMPGREGAMIPPFEHCHVTAVDCERKQSSLASQPGTVIRRPCAVVD